MSCVVRSLCTITSKPRFRKTFSARAASHCVPSRVVHLLYRLKLRLFIMMQRPRRLCSKLYLQIGETGTLLSFLKIKIKNWIAKDKCILTFNLYTLQPHYNTSWINILGGWNSTTAREVSRFQRLFPNPSWLVWGRAFQHQKLAPTFPWIDNCLMVTKRDFLKMEASLWLNEKSWVLLKVGCLPYAVGKQPFIPLI